MIKLLIADDEHIIRDGLVSMIPFEALGIVLTASCANAFEALASMEDDMPDILLTDIKMPRMDGLQLIAQAITLNPSLQCVILSGYDEFAFAQQAIRMGVREYLLKPFGKDDMIAVLRRLSDAVLDTRKKSRRSLNEHKERVAELAEQLGALIAASGAITPSRVLAAARDETLLREAFVDLVVGSDAGMGQGYSSIRNTFEEDHDLPALVAEWLTRQRESSQHSRPFVAQMKAYIHENYSDPKLSLQFLADSVVHMRADYIGREFSRETGMKLSAYLLKIRMERAKLLLLALPEENRIYEVAERVGLGHNPQYFSHLFRQYTGIAPRDFGRKPPDA